MRRAPTRSARSRFSLIRLGLGTLAFLAVLAASTAGCTASDETGDDVGTTEEREPDHAAGNPDRSPLTPVDTAVYPIVEAGEGHLFGATRNGDWISAEEAAGSVQAGQRFRLYGLTDSVDTAVAERQPRAPSEICTNPRVPLRSEAHTAVTSLIAASASWNPLPRIPARLETTQPVYRDAIAKHLATEGIEHRSSELDQVLGVDLEDDGTEEVLLVAHRLRGSPTMAEAGDYAVVLLRTVAGDSVAQIPVESAYFPEGCVGDCAPPRFQIVATLDLNGDGTLEIITHLRYFEGEGMRIYEVNDTRIEQVLSWRCGA